MLGFANLRMEAKIKKLKTDLETESDKISKTYGDGLVDGFTDPTLGLNYNILVDNCDDILVDNCSTSQLKWFATYWLAMAAHLWTQVEDRPFRRHQASSQVALP